MKNKTLIPKVAFGIAAAALLFSLVTFIKTIVQGQPQYIWIAALQVVGTALIVGVCAIVIYLSRNSMVEEDDETIEEETNNSSQNESLNETIKEEKNINKKDTDNQDEPTVIETETTNQEDKINEEKNIEIFDEKDLLSDIPLVEE